MDDQHYMQRALELATRGLGSVSPNPMVGCVIVHENKIIGEGWHEKYGEAHAEVNAVASVKNKELLSNSVFYITLEPCSFYGKTPACTDLLIKYQPKKVVIGTEDPNPKVSGHGIDELIRANIDVEVGVLESEARELNKRFFINNTLKRPYVILKWAETDDGFVARKNYDSKWISNERSRELVHKWRTEEDAILVGYNTVKYDNPLLTSRNWPGKNPARVIIDLELDLDPCSKVFDGPDKVYIVNSLEESSDKHIQKVKVNRDEVVGSSLTHLYNDGIGSIIIEGGTKTLNSFIEADLWDEARIFISEKSFSDGISAPSLNYERRNEQSLLGDRLFYTFNNKTQIHWQKK